MHNKTWVILNTLEWRVQSQVERLDVSQIKKKKRLKLHLQFALHI